MVVAAVPGDAVEVLVVETELVRVTADTVVDGVVEVVVGQVTLFS